MPLSESRSRFSLTLLFPRYGFQKSISRIFLYINILHLFIGNCAHTYAIFVHILTFLHQYLHTVLRFYIEHNDRSRLHNPAHTPGTTRPYKGEGYPAPISQTTIINSVSFLTQKHSLCFTHPFNPITSATKISGTICLTPSTCDIIPKKIFTQP